mgnify:CR=1 FL=1
MKIINDETQSKITKTIGKLLDDAEDSAIANYIEVIISTTTEIAVYCNFTERDIKTIIDNSFDEAIKNTNIRNFEKKLNNNDLFLQKDKKYD